MTLPGLQRFRVPSVRAGLTLWYAGAMLIVLGVYAAGVFAFVQRSVSHGLDAQLRSDFSWAAEMWQQQPDGTVTWFSDGTDEDAPWLQVWNGSGRLLYRSAVARRIELPGADDFATDRISGGGAAAEGRIATVAAHGYTFRVLSRATTVAGHPVVIQVARSEALARAELRELAMFLALGLPFGVAAAGCGGYLLARRALRPIERMADQARTITAARLSDRLPVRRHDDELGRLAMVFNDTLERLERSFGEMQQFTADVSHQLRTPLTAIRMVGEVGLRDARDVASCRALIGSMLEEVDRLTSLVERLLAMSRTTSAQARARLETIELGDLAREVAAHLGVLADEKGQSIVFEQRGAAYCRGDRLTLRQALINLVDNAIKYSPEQSVIELRVAATPAGALVEVCDRGPGVASERSGNIFERFYRASADTASSGVGLGLSISKWAVEASHGQLIWESRTGGGSTFRITLPTGA